MGNIWIIIAGSGLVVTLFPIVYYEVHSLVSAVGLTVFMYGLVMCFEPDHIYSPLTHIFVAGYISVSIFMYYRYRHRLYDLYFSDAAVSSYKDMNQISNFDAKTHSGFTRWTTHRLNKDSNDALLLWPVMILTGSL